jgi:hypothetical protein
MTGRRRDASAGPREWRRFSRVGVAAAALLVFTACQRVGVPPPPRPVTAAACPARAIDTRDWLTVADSTGVAFRLPPSFVERALPGEPYRRWTSTIDPSGGITIGLSPSREHFTTLRRVPSPNMHEMTECVEEGSSGQILLQAWRTEGGIFRDGRRADLYEMLVLVPLEPMRTLFVTGGGSDPQFQAMLLQIARTVVRAR